MNTNKRYKVMTLLWDNETNDSEHIEFYVEAQDWDQAYDEADCYMALEHNQELYNADTTIQEVK
jgi:hypothetical protein